MTSYGPSCPQQALNFVPPQGLDPQALQYLLTTSGASQVPESEDCTRPKSYISQDLTCDDRLDPKYNPASQSQSQDQVTSRGREFYTARAVAEWLTAFTVDLWRRVPGWDDCGVTLSISC